MKRIIVSLMILCCLQCKLYSENILDKEIIKDWTVQDTVLQSVFVSLIIIDIGQTNYFLNIPPEDTGESLRIHEESNIILGRNPSKIKLYLAGIGGIILHTGITYGLGKIKCTLKIKPIWQSIWIGTRIKTIQHNYNAVGGFYIKF